ncbi:MAG: CrcB family protein [Microbacteriaceae bacterium]|nr:CrcB family protein [Microbacteriaceae bacterium]
MTVVAVLIGGVLGTGLRLGVDALLPHEGTGFPWSTLLINVTGSFVLGFLVSRVWPAAPAWLRAGLGTGLLGSFTTFSALAASLVAISAGGAALTALAYLAASLVAGFGAAWLGLRLGSARPPVVLREDE